jgi:hypothetical protein
MRVVMDRNGRRYVSCHGSQWPNAEQCLRHRVHCGAEEHPSLPIPKCPNVLRVQYSCHLTRNYSVPASRSPVSTLHKFHHRSPVSVIHISKWCATATEIRSLPRTITKVPKAEVQSLQHTGRGKWNYSLHKLDTRV